MAKELKESTIAEYEKKLNKIQRDVEIEDPVGIMDWLEKMGFGESTKKAYLSAVKYDFGRKGSAFPEVLQKEINRLYGIQNQRADAQVMTPKQEERMVDWETVRVKAHQYIRDYNVVPLSGKGPKVPRPDNGVDYDERVWIAGLYTFQAPVRADYGDMLVSKGKSAGDDVGNELVMRGREDSYFIFRDYKTAKTYGNVEIILEPEMWDLFGGEWFVGAYAGEYIFADKSSKQFSSMVLDTFEEILGVKGFGVSMLRHSYIMHMFPKLKTIRQKEELAKSMLHSRITQENYNLVGTAD